MDEVVIEEIDSMSHEPSSDWEDLQRVKDFEHFPRSPELGKVMEIARVLKDSKNLLLLIIFAWNFHFFKHKIKNTKNSRNWAYK